MSIAENVAAVRERIADAVARGGRESREVTLMLAAKHQPVESLLEAVEAGVHTFGHNIVQQLQGAVAGLREAGVTTSNAVIGPVQSNKLRAAMDAADRIDSVDSLKTATRIARRQEARIAEGLAEGPYPVLIQVNSSGSTTQGGCVPDELLDLAGNILELGLVRVDGLMTIGAHTSDEAKVRESFALTRELAERMRTLPGLESATVLSMGMTGDLEIAVEEGSTVVRVGTAVFGERQREGTLSVYPARRIEDGAATRTW